MKIHGKEEDGHILVFLTGQDEIEKACAMIRSRALDLHSALGPDQEGGFDLVVLPLYASLPTEAQRLVFKKTETGQIASNDKVGEGSAKAGAGQGDNKSRRLRKCVVATNIAETSITVPNDR